MEEKTAADRMRRSEGRGLTCGPKDEVYLLTTAISLVAAVTLPLAAGAQKEWLTALPPPTARLFLSNGMVIAITLGVVLNATLRAALPAAKVPDR